MMVKADAKRTAILTHASAMERKHAVPMEVELLWKKWERMERETSGAEFEVLREFSEQDGMESYFERTKEMSELPGVRQASIIPVAPTAMRETSEKGIYSPF